jgi:hypothetical protein
VSHTSAEVAKLVGRTAAFAVGIVAYYFAFFLYENEDGVWQNRIDNLWRAVYQRAEVTNDTTVALFNKIGDVLHKGFDWVFGKKLLSFRSFAISVNLSLAGGGVAIFLLSIMQIHKGEGQPEGGSKSLVGLTWLFFCFAALPVAFKERKWASIISLVPIILIMLVALFMFPLLILHPGYQSQPSDYLAIVVMRKLFISISKTYSAFRIAFIMLALVLFSLLVVGFPTKGIMWLGQRYPDVIGLRIEVLGIELFFFNFTTALLCLIPAIILALLLLHKLLWPFLSRMLSPFSRYKIITNKKALLAIGTVAMTIAFNLEHVGWKFLLDHVK